MSAIDWWVSKSDFVQVSLECQSILGQQWSYFWSVHDSKVHGANMGPIWGPMNSVVLTWLYNTHVNDCSILVRHSSNRWLMQDCSISIANALDILQSCNELYNIAFSWHFPCHTIRFNLQYMKYLFQLPFQEFFFAISAEPQFSSILIMLTKIMKCCNFGKHNEVIKMYCLTQF